MNLADIHCIIKIRRLWYIKTPDVESSRKESVDQSHDWIVERWTNGYWDHTCNYSSEHQKSVHLCIHIYEVGFLPLIEIRFFPIAFHICEMVFHCKALGVLEESDHGCCSNGTSRTSYKTVNQCLVTPQDILMLLHVDSTSNMCKASYHHKLANVASQERIPTEITITITLGCQLSYLL